MRSDGLTNFVTILSLVVALIVGVVTINATFETAQWGGSPPKRLSANYIGPSNPLEELAIDGSNLSIVVAKDGQSLRNLRIVQASLTNDGASPILASDMFEPLGLKADESWKIVSIANQTLFRDTSVKLQWHRISDREFGSQSTLLNPGDGVHATVYLDWNGPGDPPEPSLEQVPIVTWTGRISNLRRIETAPDIFEDIARKAGPVMVKLWGWGVPFTLLSFLTYNALTILLFVRSGLMPASRASSVLALAVAGVLNLAAAEAGATYVFGAEMLADLPVDHLLNAPLILVNLLMLIGLGIVARKRSRGLISAEAGSSIQVEP